MVSGFMKRAPIFHQRKKLTGSPLRGASVASAATELRQPEDLPRTRTSCVKRLRMKTGGGCQSNTEQRGEDAPTSAASYVGLHAMGEQVIHR